jgi:ferredoxin
MANPEDKFPQNVPGAFYVDDQCIACDACVMEAPEHFKMDDEDGHAYVFFQPTTPIEIEMCQNALSACPVEAIGDNGKSSED